LSLRQPWLNRLRSLVCAVCEMTQRLPGPLRDLSFLSPPQRLGGASIQATNPEVHVHPSPVIDAGCAPLLLLLPLPCIPGPIAGYLVEKSAVGAVCPRLV
jgi:hypothetical protein